MLEKWKLFGVRVTICRKGEKPMNYEEMGSWTWWLWCDSKDEIEGGGGTDEERAMEIEIEIDPFTLSFSCGIVLMGSTA